MVIEVSGVGYNIRFQVFGCQVSGKNPSNGSIIRHNFILNSEYINPVNGNTKEGINKSDWETRS